MDNLLEPSDLTEILRGVAAGDRDAWEWTIRRFTGTVLAVCRRHRMTLEESADVAQLTWLRLFTHAHQIRDPRGFAGWLATTASRECLAILRRERREIPLGERDIPAAEETDIDARLDEARHRRVLRQSIQLLRRRERVLVEVLLEPEQPSYADISRRLGMPIGAIGPVRQRALRNLRRQLTDPPMSSPAQRVA
jgi:RNA polymerase sigma factor (sigma-70 family)